MVLEPGLVLVPELEPGLVPELVPVLELEPGLVPEPELAVVPVQHKLPVSALDTCYLPVLIISFLSLEFLLLIRF